MDWNQGNVLVIVIGRLVGISRNLVWIPNRGKIYIPCPKQADQTSEIFSQKVKGGKVTGL